MEEKPKNKSIKEKMYEMAENRQKSLAKDIGSFIFIIKIARYTLKQLPKAISQKNEDKKKGEAELSVFDYIEEPEYDIGEETEKTLQVLKKMKALSEKISLIYVFKTLYKTVNTFIQNRNVKKLPSGKSEEEISQGKMETSTEKRDEMVKELSEGAPSLEEQRAKNEKLLNDTNDTNDNTVKQPDKGIEK